jgi:hypothetical protein
VFIPCEGRTLANKPLFRAILFPAKASFEPPYSSKTTEKHARPRTVLAQRDHSSPHANSSAASAPMQLYGAHAAPRRACSSMARTQLYGAHAALWRARSSMARTQLYGAHAALRRACCSTAPILLYSAHTASRLPYCFTAPILLHSSHTAPQPPCRRVDI